MMLKFKLIISINTSSFKDFHKFNKNLRELVYFNKFVDPDEVKV